MQTPASWTQTQWFSYTVLPLGAKEEKSIPSSQKTARWHHSGRLRHDMNQRVSLLQRIKSSIETLSEHPTGEWSWRFCLACLYIYFLMTFFFSFWLLKLRSWVIPTPASGSRCQWPEADLRCADSEQGWPGSTSPVSDRGTSDPQNQPWRGETKAKNQHKLNP